MRPQLPEPSSERAERFRALYAAGYLDVLRFVQRRVHPTHAEDVVAEAFLVVWRRIDELPARPSDQRAWLFGIARNCLLNARRGAHRAEALAVRLADADSGASTRASEADRFDVEQLATRADLAVAWARLAPGEQEVLALTVFEQLTSPEAARVLGISSAAYRLRLLRARRALRARLDPTPSAAHLTARQGATDGLV